jgi:hypothetical protein
MTPQPHDDPEGFIHRIVHPIVASPRRKQMMTEELLAHLTDATANALGRFGDPDELRQQLQASVSPLERTFYASLLYLEPVMTRILWIVGIVAFTAGAHLHFALNTFVEFAGLLLLCALAFKHLCQPNNVASRTLGRRWPWYLAPLSILFGTSMILPAWAQLNRGQSGLFLVPLVTGALIALCGIGILVYATRMNRASVA